jgi:TolB-like protein/class 3 adenylate cyclase/Tfp pilus assembly protein PilF
VASEEIERRLVAILMADVAGYSRLIGTDDEGTLAQLNAHHTELIEPKINKHRGRVVRTTGDGLLVLYVSVVDALRCAVEIQRTMAQRNAQVPQQAQIAFRMGINVGDIVEGTSIHGDGVNVAARLEALAEVGGICVSGRVKEDAQGSLGRLGIAFEDLGQHKLKNIDHEVQVYRVLLDHAAAKVKPALPLPDRPSIAVLPFQNMSDDPGQDYFADGMVEEITTALSRFRDLFVIARNSSFTYKGRNVDAKQIGRELGVRYLVEGSVRKAGNHLRLTGKLIEAANGMHLWAERFDGTPSDVFALQDQLTSSIVGSIMPRLSQAESERAKHKPTGSLDAYDYYMRGLSRLHDDSKDGIADAQQLFSKAIDLDPRYALAHATAAMCIEARLRNGLIADLRREVDQAERLARRAAALGGDDAYALASAGFVLARVVGDLDDGAAFVDRALILNANYARAWHYSGWVQIWLGEPALGIEHVNRAMRFSPVDPALSSMQTAIGFAHFFLKRDHEASFWAAKALGERPHFQPALRLSAASNALEGRIETAKEAIARLGLLNPDLRLSNLKARSAPQRRPEYFSRYEEGLRKAGLPE